MKKLAMRFTCIVLVISCLVGCTPSGKDDSKAFDQFTYDLFIEEMEGSVLDCNFMLVHPEEYGLEDAAKSLGEFSLATLEENFASVQDAVKEMEQFDYSRLTDEQQVTYDVLADYWETAQMAQGMLLYNEVLDETVGLQAQMPSLLGEYSFRTQQDIEDYLLLLADMNRYFEQIIAFEQEKSKAGLFMADFTADSIINQCKEFIKEPEKIFLIDVVNNKIDSFPGLSEEQKTAYKEKNRQLITTDVVKAYETLITGLTELKGTGVNDKGLSYFEKGKEWYAYLVRQKSCSDRPVDEQFELMGEYMQNALIDYINTMPAYPNFAEDFDDPTGYCDTTDPVGTLEYLREQTKADFPQLKEVDFTVKSIDPALSESASPAFYLTQPIDVVEQGKIYLNPKYADTALYATLAHEGYPGHLYQDFYEKQLGLPEIRHLLNFQGYSEGWGTYAEHYSYQLSKKDPAFSSMMHNNALISFGLHARVDIGVHYYGWTEKEILKEFENWGLMYDDKTVEEMYHRVISNPANYVGYYMGYLEFLELRDLAMETKGSSFSLKEFHTFLLDMGSMPFNLLEDYMLAQMKAQKAA